MSWPMALATRANIAIGKGCQYLSDIAEAWRQPFTDFDERLADEALRDGSLWDSEAKAQRDKALGDGLAKAEASRGYCNRELWAGFYCILPRGHSDAHSGAAGGPFVLDSCAAPVSPPSGVDQSAGAAHSTLRAAPEAAADEAERPAADSSAQDAAAGLLLQREDPLAAAIRREHDINPVGARVICIVADRYWENRRLFHLHSWAEVGLGDLATKWIAEPDWSEYTSFPTVPSK